MDIELKRYLRQNLFDLHSVEQLNPPKEHTELTLSGAILGSPKTSKKSDKKKTAQFEQLLDNSIMDKTNEKTLTAGTDGSEQPEIEMQPTKSEVVYDWLKEPAGPIYRGITHDTLKQGIYKCCLQRVKLYWGCF